VRRVLLALSTQEGWGNVGWASDWGKNIYAPTAFLGDQNSDPKTFSVRTQFTAPDGAQVDKTWKVCVCVGGGGRRQWWVFGAFGGGHKGVHACVGRGGGGKWIGSR